MNVGRYLIFAAFGFELAALVVGGLYLGSEVDKRYELNGLGLAGGALLGLGIWIYHLIVVNQRLARMEKNDPPSSEVEP